MSQMQSVARPVQWAQVEFNIDMRRVDEPHRLLSWWFQTAWQTVGGSLRDELVRHPLPDREFTDDHLAARVPPEWSTVGMPYLQLSAARINHKWPDWNRNYTAAAMDDFIQLLATDPVTATMGNGGIIAIATEPMLSPRPAFPYLTIGMSRDDTEKHQVKLGISADSSFLLQPPQARQTLLALTRSLSDQAEPSYGECGLPHPHRSSPLSGTGAYVSEEQARQTLRGFSWLTVVPAELAQRLGGAEAVRATAAFVEVHPLRHGGLWLLATPRIEDFNKAAAQRVFDALAPVLPAQLHGQFQLIEGTFNWSEASI